MYTIQNGKPTSLGKMLETRLENILYCYFFSQKKDISITLNQQNNTFEEEIHQIKCDWREIHFVTGPEFSFRIETGRKLYL